MEGKKPAESESESSSSKPPYSITERLFGSTHCADTTEVINVIFSPKSKQALANSEVADNKEGESTKTKTIEEELNSIENEKRVWGNMKTLYDEQRVNQPCGLSSSIYYGGQDFYRHPDGTINPALKKLEEPEDNPDAANRGDWWQGSLYY